MKAQTKAEHVATHTSARNRIASDLQKQAMANQIYRRKADAVRQVMEEKRQNAIQIAEQRRLEMMRSTQMKRRIQAQRQTLRAKRQQIEEQKKIAARRNFAERVSKEAERSLQCEKKVQAMEKEELELIRLLESAQQQQRKAYGELEVVVHETREVMAAQRHEEREEQHKLVLLRHGSNTPGAWRSLAHSSQNTPSGSQAALMVRRRSSVGSRSSLHSSRRGSRRNSRSGASTARLQVAYNRDSSRGSLSRNAGPGLIPNRPPSSARH